MEKRVIFRNSELLMKSENPKVSIAYWDRIKLVVFVKKHAQILLSWLGERLFETLTTVYSWWLRFQQNLILVLDVIEAGEYDSHILHLEMYIWSKFQSFPTYLRQYTVKII